MTSLQAAIDDFLRVLAVEENVSPNTVRAYAADLNQLAQSLAGRARTEVATLPCTALDRDAVRAFLVERLKATKRSSAARKLSAVKRFARHLLRSGAITIDPCAGIQAPRQDKSLPAHLPVDDMFRLLTAPLPDAPAGLRDRALLEVAYSCGLRVSELVGLDWSDVDERLSVVRVLGKGRKERIVPIGDAALDALRAYRDAIPASARAAFARPRRCSSTSAAAASRCARSAASSTPIRCSAASPARSARTPCATASRPTCSAPAPTCAPSRRCSATPASRPRRSTPTSISTS